MYAKRFCNFTAKIHKNLQNFLKNTLCISKQYLRALSENVSVKTDPPEREHEVSFFQITNFYFRLMEY